MVVRIIRFGVARQSETLLEVICIGLIKTFGGLVIVSEIFLLVVKKSLYKKGPLFGFVYIMVYILLKDVEENIWYI